MVDTLEKAREKVQQFIVRQDGTVQDIYPAYADLIPTEPIYRSPDGIYLVLGYDANRKLLRDSRFSRWAAAQSEMGDLERLQAQARRAVQCSVSSVINRDDPDHARLRKLIRLAFLPGTVSGWIPLIREEAATIVTEAMAIEGPFNFLEKVSKPLPEAVICRIAGVPFEDRSKWSSWADRIVRLNRVSGSGDGPAQALQATVEFYEYMSEFVKSRRDHLGEDLVSDLIRASEDEDSLTQEELVGNMMTLVLAGHETTSNLVNNAVYHMLRQPALFRQLRDHPDLCDNAVEEFLRAESPAHTSLPRIAMADVEYEGTVIPAGAKVVFDFAAANRDPAVFSHANTIDFARPELSRHIGFGFGIHSCAGQHLARLEASIMLRELATRMPELEIVNSPRWPGGKPGMLDKLIVEIRRG